VSPDFFDRLYNLFLLLISFVMSGVTQGRLGFVLTILWGICSFMSLDNSILKYSHILFTSHSLFSVIQLYTLISSALIEFQFEFLYTGMDIGF